MLWREAKGTPQQGRSRGRGKGEERGEKVFEIKMGKEDRKQVYIALVMSCTRMDDRFQIRSESSRRKVNSKEA